MIFKRELTIWYFSMFVMNVIYGALLLLYGMSFDDPSLAIKLMVFPAAAGAGIGLVSYEWWKQTSPFRNHYKFNTHCVVASGTSVLMMPTILIIVTLIAPNFI